VKPTYIFAGNVWYFNVEIKFNGFFGKCDDSLSDTHLRKHNKQAQLTLTRANQKDAKIAPIRRVSFHFTEFHFPKFQITNA